MAAAVKQAATDDGGPSGWPIRRGREGAAVPIVRAAHRGGSPLEHGSGSAWPSGPASQCRGDEVEKPPSLYTEVTYRLRQVVGYRDFARGETEPGADERRWEQAQGIYHPQQLEDVWRAGLLRCH